MIHTNLGLETDIWGQCFYQYSYIGIGDAVWSCIDESDCDGRVGGCDIEDDWLEVEPADAISSSEGLCGGCCPCWTFDWGHEFEVGPVDAIDAKSSQERLRDLFCWLKMCYNS